MPKNQIARSSSPLFDPKQLRSFVVLARYMHFGRAAEALGISQPALSLQIRALEEMVGAPLINRSNRTLMLTEVGERFLADAQQILAMMERAKRNAEELLAGEEAVIRLGVCPGIISSNILVSFLEAARRRYPRVDIRCEVAPPVSLLGLLEAGKIDISAGLAFGIEMPSHIVSREIAVWDAVLAVPQELPVEACRMAASGCSDKIFVNSDILREQTFICYEGVKDDYPKVVESLLGFTPKRTMSTPSSRLMMAYVDAGRGVVIIPSADALEKGPNTRIIPIPGGERRMRAVAARLASSNAPAIRRIFDLICSLSEEGR